MVVITIKETNDEHVKKIRENFRCCAPLGTDVYTGKNVKEVRIYFNNGIGGHVLTDVVDIDLSDPEVMFVLTNDGTQSQGSTHIFEYAILDELTKPIMKEA